MNPRWWRRALALAAFGCLWWNVYDDPPLATGGYVQDVQERSACVAIVTATPQRATLRVEGSGGAVVSVADEAACRRHALAAGGLQPATRYTWRLAGEGWEETGSFRTAGAGDHEPLRFALLGDSGRMPPWVWLQRAPIVHWLARGQWLPTSDAVTRIGAALAAYEPEFVLHLGDVVYPRGLNAHYSAGFFRPFAAVMRSAPIYAVLGNHDAMDDDGLQMLGNLRLPPNWLTGDGRCFSFARGPVRVIGVDCNTDRTGDHFAPDHPAYVYLQRELGAASEPWIVVASHFPMRSASRQWDREELVEHMLPLLREHAVSLYLSGHDHCYQRFAGDSADPVVVVSGGGGKDLYEVRPQSRTMVPRLRPVVLESRYHWCAVEVERGEAVLRALGLEGAEFDRCALPLPSGSELEKLRDTAPKRALRIAELKR